MKYTDWSIEEEEDRKLARMQRRIYDLESALRKCASVLREKDRSGELVNTERDALATAERTLNEKP